ncbi:MAG: glycosyltransferase family 4 protein [Bacteriovoracia bacterium]
MVQKKHVAFLIPTIDSAWLGGVSYLRNLFSVFDEDPEKTFFPILFVGEVKEPNLLKDFPPHQVVVTNLLKRKSISWFSSKISEIFFRRNYPLENLLKAHSIDWISHSIGLGLKTNIPVLGWIPDFQHKHLPEYFSKEEIKKRNITFEKICRSGKKIFVSSEHAKKDLADSFPKFQSKAVVFHFVTDAPQQTKVSQNKEKFFFLPNQFWKHKNHRVVLEALLLLKSKNRSDITVYCTGKTEDYRDPSYFLSLSQKIHSERLESQFQIKGVVSKALMNSYLVDCVAVINPSLFEGWSTTVEEAKSLGKRVILSNIAVHIEQNPKRSVYFDPNNAQQLAEILEKVWDEYDLAQEDKETQAALKENSRRKNELLSVYKHAVKDSHLI